MRTVKGPRVVERRAALAVLVLLPFVLGAATGAPTDGGDVAFTFTDPEIAESSGLVVTRGLTVTVNDSGDVGRVFVVDPATGRTVGTTSWAEQPQDVEALAAAGPGQVWVADIGDNLRRRDEVSVLRVPVDRGDRSVEPQDHRLRYPDGPRDAETLLSHPLTGRVYVVTKGVFAGEVLEAPMTLSTAGVNLLTEVGRTGGLVTDGSFLPWGGAVALRDYGRVTVYAFPSWEPVASWVAPKQEQGEGLAVDGTDLLLSSEGVGEAVLREPLPPAALLADIAHSPLATVVQAVGVATVRPLPQAPAVPPEA